MEMFSIILCIPLLLLICWGLGALIGCFIIESEQHPLEQIVIGFIILIIVGLLGRM